MSLKFAEIVECGVLFYLRWRSCLSILGDHCQTGVIVKEGEESVLISLYYYIVLCMYPRFFLVYLMFWHLEKTEEVNICDVIRCLILSTLMLLKPVSEYRICLIHKSCIKTLQTSPWSQNLHRKNQSY